MKTSGLIHFSFRLEADPSVVPYNMLRGCDGIKQTLEREIRTVLLNEGLYETSMLGRMPVNRFLRFQGVKSSSKETAVLSFAADCALDVFLARTPNGFEPQKHLKQIYLQAKELHVPVIVVLKNLDLLFRYDKDASSGDNYKRALNMFALAEELRQVHAGHWKIWTILLTTNLAPFGFDVDQYFLNSTEWAGNADIGDIFDDMTRAKILKDCLLKYIPEGDAFPFDNNISALLGFSNQFTQHCTYRQIEEFVRSIVNRWKYQIPPGEILLVGHNDTRLIPTTSDFVNAVKGKQSISPYPVFDWNIAPFVTIFNSTAESKD